MNAASFQSFYSEHRYAPLLDDDALSAEDECLAGPAPNGSSHSAAPDTDTPEIPDREALYAELQSLVQRLIMRYGKTPELRRDLQGEIYYRFCRLVAEYNPDRGIPIRPYVICKLQQQIFNYARSHWRVESRTAPLELPDGSERDLPPLRVEDDPLQKILTQEIYNVLPETISELPRRQRLVIIYRYYEGLSYEEIAQRMGGKVVSIRSLQRFALEALRRKMRQKGLISL